VVLQRKLCPQGGQPHEAAAGGGRAPVQNGRHPQLRNPPQGGAAVRGGVRLSQANLQGSGKVAKREKEKKERRPRGGGVPTVKKAPEKNDTDIIIRSRAKEEHNAEPKQSASGRGIRGSVTSLADGGRGWGEKRGNQSKNPSPQKKGCGREILSRKSGG